jgi:hypothetical protein
MSLLPIKLKLPLAQELDQQRQTIADLEVQRDEATADDYAGVDGAGKQLADVEFKLKVARDRFVYLERAQATNARREEEKAATSKASLRRTLVASASKHLDLVASAAADLEKHIAAASAAYATMMEQAQKALAVTMIPPVEWPHAASEISELSLDNQVRAEMLRYAEFTGSGVVISGHALPGAAIGDPAQTANPQAGLRLGQAIYETAQMLKAQLKMKLPK